MSSLLGENKLLLLSKKLSSYSRFLITFSIISFFFACWLFIFYLPLDRLIKKELRLKSIFLNRFSQVQISLKNFTKTQEHKAKLIQNSKSLLKKSVLQGCVNRILDLLKKNNVACSLFDPVDFKKKDFYKKEYFVLKIKGTFLNIFSFLDELHTIAKNVKFKKINFFKNEDGTILFDAKLRIITFSKSYVS